MVGARALSASIPMETELFESEKLVFNRETGRYEKVKCLSRGITAEKLQERMGMILDLLKSNLFNLK